MTTPTTGTRVVTAYGPDPSIRYVTGLGKVTAEYGTITRVGEDGWHDVTLDISGRVLLLNDDRFVIVPTTDEDTTEDETETHPFRDHPHTYPRVRTPMADPCHICSETDHGTTPGLAWYPTEHGDRPVCRNHLELLDGHYLVTTNAHTSEHGNTYPAWTEDDTETWKAYGGDETNAHEDEDPSTEPLTVETLVTTTAREVTARVRDEDVARIMSTFTADVPTSLVGMYAYNVRRIIRNVLDMGSGDTVAFLYRVFVDEDTDTWSLQTWDESTRRVVYPCAVLVRTWEYDTDRDGYAPTVRVIFRTDDGWDAIGECVRVDVPETWWEWE